MLSKARIKAVCVSEITTMFQATVLKTHTHPFLHVSQFLNEFVYSIPRLMCRDIRSVLISLSENLYKHTQANEFKLPFGV